MNVACLCDIWMVQEQDLENEKRQEKKKTFRGSDKDVGKYFLIHKVERAAR